MLIIIYWINIQKSSMGKYIWEILHCLPQQGNSWGLLDYYRLLVALQKKTEINFLKARFSKLILSGNSFFLELIIISTDTIWKHWLRRHAYVSYILPSSSTISHKLILLEYNISKDAYSISRNHLRNHS